MSDYNFHTADAADTPHVVVFTTKPFEGETEQDEVVAEFYPLKGEKSLDQAELRAISFLRHLTGHLEIK